MTYYPGIEEVISAHGRLIARFGGTLGIRDRAALESALARPRTGYYDDLIQAALWESLSQNHPFLDGNKRTAITDPSLRERRISFCRTGDMAASTCTPGRFARPLTPIGAIT